MIKDNNNIKIIIIIKASIDRNIDQLSQQLTL